MAAAPSSPLMVRLARALVELSPAADLHRLVADQVRELAGDGVVTVGTCEAEERAVQWRAVAGPPAARATLERRLGLDAAARTRPLPEAVRALLATPGPHPLLADVAPLLAAAEGAAASPDALLSTDGAVGVGMSWHGDLLGVIVVLGAAPTVAAAGGELAALADLAAVALQQRRATTALARSEQRYREILDLLPGALMECDLTGRITFVNRQTLEMTGYDVDDVRAGLTVASFLVPEDRPRAIASVRAVLEGIPAYGNQYRARRKDGTVYELAVYSTPLHEDGRVTGMRGIGIDVTQATRAREALQDSERRYRELVDLLPVGVVECDATGTIVLANAHMTAMTGYSPEDVRAGLHVAMLVVPEDRGRVRTQLTGVVEGETHVGAEYHALCKDGTTREVAIYASPISRGGARVGFRGVAVDITEHKRAEEQQRLLQERAEQARKLESLGVLTGGIAHDFNNLLVAVLGNAELALQDLPPDSSPHARVAKVRKVAKRAAELVNQLLAYSGGGSVHRSPVDLNAVVAEIEPLLHGAAARPGAVRYEYGPQPLRVEGDLVQLRQIVMNLVLNASEALGDGGGTVTVRTGLRQADAAMLEGAHYGEGLPPGTYVFLEVADTGCGMDAPTLRRIFEPFFTTKFTGRGLGLAAVLGIVRGHRGAITVTSAPGEGSVFTVLLPPADEAAR